MVLPLAGAFAATVCEIDEKAWVEPAELLAVTRSRIRLPTSAVARV